MVCGSGATRWAISPPKKTKRSLPREERGYLVEYTNCWSVETGDGVAVELRSETPGGGCLHCQNLHSHWNLTSTYTKLRKIRDTYSTRTYTLNWPVTRAQHVRTSSTGRCHLLNTYLYTFNWPVPRTRSRKRPASQKRNDPDTKEKSSSTRLEPQCEQASMQL